MRKILAVAAITASLTAVPATAFADTISAAGRSTQTQTTTGTESDKTGLWGLLGLLGLAGLAKRKENVDTGLSAHR